MLYTESKNVRCDGLEVGVAQRNLATQKQILSDSLLSLFQCQYYWF